MLIDALDIKKNNEVISLVEAGGKTSFMYALARELISLQRKVLITTTTHLKKPTEKTYELMILENCPKKAAAKINQIFDTSNTVLWADKEVSDGKICGLPAESINIVADMNIADNILIEADGAKGLPIKAPTSHEPVIPTKTTIVVGVIGIDALGCRIDNNTVHRPEILSKIVQKPIGGIIDEIVIQKLICSPYGLFKGATEQMKKIVVINKVDNSTILGPAIRLAESIKNTNNIDILHIILTSFNCKTPRIRVIFIMEESSKDGIKIWGIILAAGEGKRAGGGKLSRDIQGKPMLQHVVEMATQSSLDGVLLVIGYERNLGEKIAKCTGIKSYYNPDYSLGMSTSLKLGISKVPEGISAVAIILGDMPYVQRKTLDSIVNLYKTTRSKIIIPVCNGKKGHPVLMSCKYNGEIYNILGDIGAREIIKKHRDEVMHWQTNDLGILRDIDY